jgi:hypothetical protein
MNITERSVISSDLPPGHARGPYPIPSIRAPILSLLLPPNTKKVPALSLLFLLLFGAVSCNYTVMSFATINRSATKTLSASVPAIEDAFAAEPSLKKRVYDAIGTHTLTILDF